MIYHVTSTCHRLRAQYGHDVKANALHGSSSVEHAKQSMKLVFGQELEFNEDGTVKGMPQGTGSEHRVWTTMVWSIGYGSSSVEHAKQSDRKSVV